MITTIKEDWYQSLIEDCEALLTEGIFNYRQVLIETYHELGKRISKDEGKAKDLKTHVSRDINRSVRTIERAVQFYKKFPDLKTLPDGKNVSWHKICKYYLPEKTVEKDEPKCRHCPIHCPKP